MLELLLLLLLLLLMAPLLMAPLVVAPLVSAVASPPAAGATKNNVHPYSSSGPIIRN